MRKFTLLVTLLTVALIMPFQAKAVHVSPFMVVFDKNNAAVVTLNNRSNKAKVVTFQWARRYYNQQGVVKVLPEGQTAPGYRPADPYIKHSPRRVIIKPKTAQTVRLVARRPADMAPGEYRSHFTIMVEDLVSQKADPSKNAGGVAGIVTMNVNTGIPVFIRQGETVIDAKIQQANIIQTPEGPALDVTVNNNGTRSLYTDVYVKCDGDAADNGNYIGSLRLYVERKVAHKSYPITPKKMNLGQCANPVAKIIGVRDLEYGGKLVTETPVNTGGY